MRMRGGAYYRWADCRLPNISHAEEYGGDRLIDVVGRIARTGETQIFLGIYDTTGSLIFEEYSESLPGQNVSQGIAWGIRRAKALIDAP